jgi:hypothetical protein
MMNSKCIGTWNVLTLLKPEKMQEMGQQIANTPIRNRCNTRNKEWKCSNQKK